MSARERGGVRVIAHNMGSERNPGGNPHQRGLVARIVDPIAPNLAALRRVSSKVERA
jgi:hypothetical protein